MSNLCNAATCAKLALDKVVCDAVASAVLNFYAQIVDFLRNTVNIDFSLFFKVIALLAVICWIQKWLLEIIKFICKIPKILKKFFCGKFNLCLLDCNSDSDSDTKTKSKSKSSSSSFNFNY